ncbi:hypothetical protein STENM327S_08212 [Streptomyces tendae]
MRTTGCKPYGLRRYRHRYETIATIYFAGLHIPRALGRSARRAERNRLS